MSSYKRNYQAYIVEPNRRLATPYMYLSESYRITTFSSVQLAVEQIQKYPPDLLFLSTSFSYTKSLHILETIKKRCIEKLIPVIFVVDWSQRLPKLLGTSWGNKVGLLHSLSSDDEVQATLSRVMEI